MNANAMHGLKMCTLYALRVYEYTLANGRLDGDLFGDEFQLVRGGTKAHRIHMRTMDE